MATENEHRLKAAGPIDPSNGFPLWFEDENGLRLELGINSDPFQPDPLTPAIGDLLPTTKLPGTDRFPFPDLFPDESFYFLAEAELQVGGNGTVGRARVILALEAAFGGSGDPAEGLNVVFGRIRVRIDDLIPGETYTVTHPYGVIDNLAADDRGRVFHTEDLGIVEGDPTAVVSSGKVAPFLQWRTGAPTGYIGDGVNDREISGSPFNTNFVAIEGKDIREGIVGQEDPNDRLNPKKVWTNLFAVQGRTAKRVGAWLEGSTYTKVGNGNYQLSIQARSDANQDLRLVAAGVHIQLASEGEFYTGLAQVTSLPTDAELVNISDSPPTRYPVAFVDRVIVESATHDRIAGTLTIKARSTDPDATLTIPQLNLTLSANPQQVARTAVPVELIVKSSSGGEGRQWVEVTGNPDPQQSVRAIIAPVARAFAQESIELDGSSSLGATGFSWVQTAGATVTLTNANAAKTTFTPPQADSYTFRLTVQGNGGTDSTNLTITVGAALGVDTLTVTRPNYRTRSRQFRIDGTVIPAGVPNEIVVTLIKIGQQGQRTEHPLGTAIPDIDGNWSVRKPLTQLELDLVPTVADSIVVTSKRSDPANPRQAKISFTGN